MVTPPCTHPAPRAGGSGARGCTWPPGQRPPWSQLCPLSPSAGGWHRSPAHARAQARTLLAAGALHTHAHVHVCSHACARVRMHAHVCTCAGTPPAPQHTLTHLHEARLSCCHCHRRCRCSGVWTLARGAWGKRCTPAPCTPAPHHRHGPPHTNLLGAPMGPLGLPAPDSGSVPRCCAGTPPPRSAASLSPHSSLSLAQPLGTMASCRAPWYAP